jgi:RNA polymerase sigma factor (sigma-70 family)
MSISANGVVLKRLDRLFRAGSVAGLTDAELLERFVQRRDEAAFEALLDRHGPMVLGVCRRILGNRAAADDAFQATFLVLVRKSASIHVRGSLGGWLFGVTRRVAVRARMKVERRRELDSHELDLELVGAMCTHPDVDIAPALHEELGRLPGKYRDPILLCYFEDLTHEEAARRLAWPVGTVRGRLARARELLRTRLVRRGLSLSAVSVGGWLSREAAASVSPGLARATLRAALCGSATDAAMTGAVSATVAALTTEIVRNMYLTKWTAFLASLATVGAIGAGSILLRSAAGQDPAQDPAATAAPAAGSIPSAVDDATPIGKATSIDEALAKLVSFDFQNEPLGKVFAELNSRSGLAIVPDVKAFADRGLTLETLIEARADRLALKDALKELLRPLKLDFKVKSGMVLVTARDDHVLAVESTRPSRIPQLQGEVAALDQRLAEVRGRVKHELDTTLHLVESAKLAARAEEANPAVESQPQDSANPAVESQPQDPANPAVESQPQHPGDAIPAPAADAQVGQDQSRPDPAADYYPRSASRGRGTVDRQDSPAPSFVEQTRGTVEEQLVQVLRTLRDMEDRLAKDRDEQKAIDALHAVLSRSEPRVKRLGIDDPDGSKTSAAAFLDKALKDATAESARLKEQVARNEDLVSRTRADLNRLREVHVILVGSTEASNNRLRSALANQPRLHGHVVVQKVRDLSELKLLEKYLSVPPDEKP